MKQRFIELLKDTGRKGIDSLIEEMEQGGFFDAPCSGQHHLAKEGGLLEHSLNVFECMDNLACAVESDSFAGVPSNSIIICSLLHDLGKMGDYGKPNYVPNMIRSKKKNEHGEYDIVQSEAKPFETNSELLYVPHEVRSVSIASKHIQLTEDEYFAILYHNGLYGDFRYVISGKETPLYLLLHFADMWCSRVVEIEKEKGEE